MKKTKKLPSIKVGPFKPVKYYEADITGPDKWVEEIVGVGKQVITNDQYFNIGIIHILSNAIDGQFDLGSIKKKKQTK